jgi:tetratricopeptide (TPR) repeat protein
MLMVRLARLIPALLLAAGLYSTHALAQDQNACFQATLETTGDKAISLCSRVIASGQAKGHSLAIALNNRGLGYMKNRDTERALKDFNEAIRLSPKYPFAYDNRGDVRRERGQYDLALVDYNAAIRFDPNFTSAYLNRGMTFEKMGNIESARADYDALLAKPANRPIDKWAHTEARKRLNALAATRSR